MIKLPPTRQETRDAFEAIARAMATDHVEISVMFGMPSLKVHGKSFAGIFGDDIVFKLHGEPHAKALGIKGAKLFDPSGSGRAMKEWVVLPFAQKGWWSGTARDALAYALTAPPAPAETGNKKSLAPPSEKAKTVPPAKVEVTEKKKSIPPAHSAEKKPAVDAAKSPLKRPSRAKMPAVVAPPPVAKAPVPERPAPNPRNKIRPL